MAAAGVADLLGIYPVSAPAASIGPNPTFASYHDSMDFGFIAKHRRDRRPDAPCSPDDAGRQGADASGGNAVCAADPRLRKIACERIGPASPLPGRTIASHTLDCLHWRSAGHGQVSRRALCSLACQAHIATWPHPQHRPLSKQRLRAHLRDNLIRRRARPKLSLKAGHIRWAPAQRHV
ncbi:hypothetical protein A4G26_20525 [Mycobacterium kansasii]|nr:hypothetical protein A4G26_20525 [Mycobacterium kansasii]